MKQYDPNVLKEAKKIIRIENIFDGYKKRVGKYIIINPCPVCGHKDHFSIDTNRNTFKSQSGCFNGGNSVIDAIIIKYSCNYETAVNELLKLAGLDHEVKDTKEIYKKAQKIKAEAEAEEAKKEKCIDFFINTTDNLHKHNQSTSLGRFNYWFDFCLTGYIDKNLNQNKYDEIIKTMNQIDIIYSKKLINFYKK